MLSIVPSTDHPVRPRPWLWPSGHPTNMHHMIWCWLCNTLANHPVKVQLDLMITWLVNQSAPYDPMEIVWLPNGSSSGLSLTWRQVGQVLVCIIFICPIKILWLLVDHLVGNILVYYFLTVGKTYQHCVPIQSGDGNGGPRVIQWCLHMLAFSQTGRSSFNPLHKCNL